ncbi:DHA2 family efflux MFS transporter permease subunit [Parasphingopyxis marina]|uniref:DHA2 family efflux MFS transporter permease subunit n=1 Tax=Parasphingopyxis marina TaxID=2761622 RepID=A0A842HXM9_9SPHN|nr:DHA2 family efflux MFS transporter permease subunit [Parasphingopyxis marina]MBC2777702.1 DHA2 family efflux MFS transporter permease subunit [Parasphingopyxis marina]
MASASPAAANPGGAPLLPVRYKALLTFAIMTAMMMQILDTTIANVALPHMQTSLGATIDSVAWVLTSYIVATAVAIPITGWLSDRVGSRNLFLWSVVGFIATSMLCGAATSLEQMVIFRILQGIAAAFIGPITLTAMLDINPSHKHNSALAIWSIGAVVGPVIGPLIGGWITESYNWRWVFYVNLPIGIVTLTILYVLLPTRPVVRRSFDILGFSMFALGLASLQLVLDRGQQLDWLDSPEIWIGIGAAIVGFWVFAVHMATGRNTLLSPRIFTDRNVAGSLVYMLLAGVVVFAVMALIAPMLQTVMGYPVIEAGKLLAPRGVGVIVAMATAARLMNYVDARYVVCAGWAIAAWSCYLMTQWDLTMDWRPIVTVGLVQGFGLGFIVVPINAIAFATLPPELRTEASALLNLMRNVGASIGISVTATNIARVQQISHADLATHINPSTLPSMELHRLGLPPEVAIRLIDQEINRQALMIGYVDNFWLIMWACIIAAPTVLLLKRVPPIRKRLAQAQASPEPAA